MSSWRWSPWAGTRPGPSTSPGSWRRSGHRRRTSWCWRPGSRISGHRTTLWRVLPGHGGSWGSTTSISEPQFHCPDGHGLDSAVCRLSAGDRPREQPGRPGGNRGQQRDIALNDCSRAGRQRWIVEQSRCRRQQQPPFHVFNERSLPRRPPIGPPRMLVAVPPFSGSQVILPLS